MFQLLNIHDSSLIGIYMHFSLSSYAVDGTLI